MLPVMTITGTLRWCWRKYASASRPEIPRHPRIEEHDVRLDGGHGGDGLLAGGRGAGFIAQHLEDVAERIEHDWLIVYQNAVTAPSATRSASRSIRVTLRVPAEAAADGSTA